MKKFKKIFAVLMTLAMVLGMGMTSFAAEGDPVPGSITVKQLAAGVKVSYFQLVENDANGGWKAVDSLPESVKTSVNKILSSNGNIDWKQVDLSGLEGNGTPMSDVVNGVSTVSGLSAGLYAVQAVDPDNEYVYSWMIAYVGYQYDENGSATSDLGYAELNAKGESRQVEKETTVTSVASGDVVPFTVKAHYPTFTTGATRSFEIQDNVENGTITENDEYPIVIKVNGVDTTFANLGLIKTVSDDGKTLTVTLGSENDSYKDAFKGQQIEIVYNVVADATVSSDSPLKNKVTSEVPDRNGEAQTSQAIVVIPSLSVTIVKTDEENQPLSGAEFELWVGDTAENAVKVQDARAVNDNGEITFDGLSAAKKYWVKETKAPNGYSIEKDLKELKGASITSETKLFKKGEELPDGTTAPENTKYTNNVASDYTDVGFNAGLNFHDTTLSSLPGTGGIGTTIFTIGGCAIMIIAAALFFASRRKSAK